MSAYDAASGTVFTISFMMSGLPIGEGRRRGSRAAESVPIRTADGRHEPSDDLVEWPGRDNADPSDRDLYRWHFSRADFCS
jgi:hypothetical protein